MKKSLLFAASALLALASCTQTEMDQAPDQAISFKVAQYSASTKAAGTGSDLFEATGNSSFGVYAYYNTTEWSTETATISSVYMNNVEVSHNPGVSGETADDWEPATTYYWPKTGMLTFAGYAPKSAAGTFTKADGITFSSFTVATAPNETTALGTGNQIDLLFSDVTADQTANTVPGRYGHDGVPMVFRHALAKLNFEIKYDDSKLSDAQKLIITGTTVNSLAINKIYTSGSFKANVISPTRNWTTNTDSAISTAVALNSTPTTLASAGSTETEDYVKDYFVMPQTLSNTTGSEVGVITIKYTINPSTEELTATLPLYVASTTDTSGIVEWNPNHVYTYTLVISPVGDPILFDPTVEAWDDPATTADITVVPDADAPATE